MYISKKNSKCDFVIIGAGIIGLTIAHELQKKYPYKSIVLIEKEHDTALHASGRNSGVLHAGFYYTSDSLKARFTMQGNHELTQYCEEKGLSINKCKKVVVTRNEEELETLFELQQRGRTNGVDVSIIDGKELDTVDANARTFKYALFSPNTSTVNPEEICHSLKNDLINNDVEILCNTVYTGRIDKNNIKTGKEIIEAGMIINAAGLYADKIAHDFNFSNDYVIIPFKGLYLKYTKQKAPITTNIYPVPNLKNPFLGVHFTITVDGTVKIGPTAIPCFWRENYSGLENFNLSEFINIIWDEARLFMGNNFGFRDLALDEIKKYSRHYLINLAKGLVKNIDAKGFNQWTRPGIRAQLLNIKTRELVKDFVVEGDSHSVHILNAVSPAFTSSFPFSRWVVEQYISPYI